MDKDNTDRKSIEDQLSKPLKRNRISSRKGFGGNMLPYLETWDVTERANQIFGHTGWSSQIDKLEVEQISSGEDGERARVMAYCIVTITLYKPIFADPLEDGGNSHSGVGHGRGVSKSLEDASELAIKEAESDARKRALKNFGDQFGNCLYMGAERLKSYSFGEETSD